MQYHLENLTGEEAKVLWAALGELPAKHTFGLMRKIERQFQEQEEAALAVQRAAENPPKTTEG